MRKTVSLYEPAHAFIYLKAYRLIEPRPAAHRKSKRKTHERQQHEDNVHPAPDLYVAKTEDTLGDEKSEEASAYVSDLC